MYHAIAHHLKKTHVKASILAIVVLIGSGVALSAYLSKPIPKFMRGLNFEKSVFAKVSEDGKVTLLDQPEYERGETVHFALMNVGKFQRDLEGKNWVDMNLEIRDSKGKWVFDHGSLLGDMGHIALKDDMAESPTGVFTATASLKPGSYSLQLTVFDKIGNTQARDTGVFVVK